ncbi:MAG: TIM44-like domain-containing protein [Firmicutes bacterium]|nr:TIM44-like domain-containing protein [Bacillota bacterium]
MNTRYKLLACLVLILFMFSFAMVYLTPDAFGDTGNMTSRSKSSSSSKSTTSSKSSTSGTSSSSGYRGSSVGGIGGFFGAVIIVVVIVLLVVVFSIFKGRKGGGAVDDGEGYAFDQQAQQPQIYAPLDLGPLKERDPNFSEQAFIEKVNNMFIQLQESWTKKDWKPIRPFETDALFNQHAKQLQKFIDSGTTNVMEDIGILSSKIVAYEQDGTFDVLKVMLKTRFHDYVIDDETKNVLEGDPEEEIFMDYIWRMIRKQGTLTKVSEGTTASQCPNCGANVSINASGECDYCGSVVSRGDHDWVLSSIELIRQH